MPTNKELDDLRQSFDQRLKGSLVWYTLGMIVLGGVGTAGILQWLKGFVDDRVTTLTRPMPIPIPPAQGGSNVKGIPDEYQYCQVVRFWVPNKIPDEAGGGSIPASAETKLHAAVREEFNGYTRWKVDGQWKNPDTKLVDEEGGWLYEVGMRKGRCKDEDVMRLYTLVGTYVKAPMGQSSLYFTATRFTQPQ
jgi:hypothetical protein